MKVKYTKPAFDALVQSIKDWEDIKEQPILYESHNCPLCELTHTACDKDCEGCPIKQYTGIDDCNTTPYYDFVKKFYQYYGDKSAFDILYIVAQEEVDFLKKVLCKMLLDKNF